MFDIYIKDFNQNGQLITEETLVQTIPADKAGDLKLTNPIVKNDLGNAESFTFGIEGGTKFYDAFNQMKTFMRVVYDGDTIFYGRVLTIDNGFFGTRSFRCEGPLAFFNDSYIEGTKEESRPQKTINAYFQDLINNHNSQLNDSKRSFTLGEIPGQYTSAVSEAQQVVKNADVESKKRKYGSDSWSDTKGLVEDLRSHYGGYLRVRCLGYQNGNHYVDQGHIIDWMNHYFSTGEISQTVEVGKNVIDISSSTEVDNIFTVVIPIGNTKTRTSETVDGEKKSTTPKHFYVDGKEVTVPSICAKYGQALNSGYHTYDDYASALDKYGRIIKTVVFDDAENATQLLEKCQEWIKNNYQGEVTKFTVKAVDMHQIGDNSVSKIKVGDQVRLIYPVVKEDGTVEKKQLVRTCLSISYDLYNPENNSYTFGIPANILTKSYGVLKQAGNKDSATKPKSSGGSGSSSTRDWLSLVTEWLANHKINYKHVATPLSDPEVDNNVYPAHYPWNGSYRSGEKGPYNNWRDYFYSTEYSIGLVGSFTFWKFTPIGEGDDFDQNKLNAILKQVEDGMKYAPISAIRDAKEAAEKSYRKSVKYTKYNRELVTISGTLTHQHIIECNVIEYVKDEYGYDLTNFGNTKMPKITITDDSGVTTTYEPAEGGTIVTKEMFKEGYSSDNPTFHIVNRTNADGSIDKIASLKDADGNWQYFIVDNDGNVVPTSIRNLKIDNITDGNFRGTMVTEGFADENGHIHVYKFGQEIENWADGELVVARVDGDQVIIGSAERTTTIIEGALNNVSSVCGNFEVEVDPDTGERKVILHEGSGMFKRRDGIEMGLYDEGNLTGGIIVNKINSETTTRITGDHIVVGQRVDGEVSKDVTLMAKDTSTVGLFSILRDSQGRVIDTTLAAGTKISRTKDGITSAYGIWDASGQNVDGGMVVQKINGATTTTINGQNIILGDANTLEVHITAQQLAEFGVVDPVTGKLTAGIIARLINEQDPSQGTVSYIGGDKIIVGQMDEGGGVTKELTLMADNNLTAGLFKKAADPDDPNKEIVALDVGSKVWRSNDGGQSYAAYGIWDSSGTEIDGGIVVDKIQGKTITTINGTSIKVGGRHTVEAEVTATQLARFGLVDPVTEKLTAGIITTLINGDTTTSINGEHIKIGDEGTTRITLDNLMALSDRRINLRRSVMIGTGGGSYNHLITLDPGDGSVLADSIVLKYVDGGTWSGGTYSINGATLKQMTKSIAVDGNNVNFVRFDTTNALTISKSGNTLTFTDADGHVLSFSKATTVSGSWSGINAQEYTGPDQYTVNVTQNGENVGTKTIGFQSGSDVKMSVAGNGTASLVTGSSTKAIHVPVKVTTPYRAAQTITMSVWEGDITVSGADVYSAGWEDSYDEIGLNYSSDQTLEPGGHIVIYPTGKPTPNGEKGSIITKGITITANNATGTDFYLYSQGWANGKLTIGAKDLHTDEVISGKTIDRTLTSGVAVWDGGTVTVPIRAYYGNTPPTYEDTNASITLNLSIDNDGNNSVKLKYGSTDTGYTFNHGKYTAGQKSVTPSISWPTGWTITASNPYDSTKTSSIGISMSHGSDSTGHYIELHSNETSSPLKAKKNIALDMGSVSSGSRTVKVKFDGSDILTSTINDYKNGQDSVHPTLSGSWSSGTLTVSSSPSASDNYVRMLSQGTASWNGTIVSVPINATYGNSGQYSESTGKSVSVDVSGKLQSKSVTVSAGTHTYAPDEGYIGLSSISVTTSGGDYSNVRTRFNATSGPSYYIEAYDQSTGNAIANTTINYKLASVITKDGSYITSAKIQIQNTSGTQINNTPEFSIPLHTSTVEPRASGTSYRPADGYIGLTKVTVNLSYSNWALELVSGTSYTYKATARLNDPNAEYTNSKISSGNLSAKGAYDNGRNSVKVKAFTSDARTQLNDHRTFTYTTDASSPPSDAAQEDTWYLAGGSSWSSGKTNVYLRSGSASGTSYAVLEVGPPPAGTITNDTTLPSGASSSGTLSYGKYIKIGAGYYSADAYYKAPNDRSAGTITKDTTLPSGVSSSGTITRGKYIKIGSGYYSADKYYLAQNVSNGTATPNTSLPSGVTSSGTINRGSYIKIGAGYYSSDKYYLAQNVSDGTITKDTTLPSGTSSSGTITRGKYIKIGAGYYGADKYYLAQNVSNGTISPNTTLPSGASSSGTLSYGKYIKIGAGYYSADKYYKASDDRPAGTITINTSGGSSSGTLDYGKQIKIGAGYYSADKYYTAPADRWTDGRDYGWGTAVQKFSIPGPDYALGADRNWTSYSYPTATWNSSETAYFKIEASNGVARLTLRNGSVDGAEILEACRCSYSTASYSFSFVGAGRVANVSDITNQGYGAVYVPSTINVSTVKGGHGVYRYITFKVDGKKKALFFE